MKANQGHSSKYPLLTLTKGDKTYHRVMSGELAGLTVTTAIRSNMRAVRVEHDKVKGFAACTVVDTCRSIDWIIDRLVSDIRLSF